MKTNLFVLLCFFCSLNSAIAQSGNQLFTNDALHEIRITFEEEDFWSILINNYGIGIEPGLSIPYLMAQVEIDGTVLDSIGVRQKGFSSYFSSNEFKKSLKLDFNEYVPGRRYDGLRKINLNNGVGDPSLQRDFLCFDMIREAGGIAPRVAYAKVYLNDEYWGIYVLVEQIDKEFLDNNFSNPNGNLFKNIGWSNLEWLGTDPTAYQGNFELKTNEDIGDWARFIEFMDFLNNSSIADFEENIQDYFNVDLYLRTLAIDVMTDNWDSYIEHGRNWYLYQDSATNAFQWIPWDYNLGMGGDFNSAESPNPPFDSICPFILDFNYSRDDLTLSFSDQSDSLMTTWFWNFGDDSTSIEQNPIHTFMEAQEFEVCLTTSLMVLDSICEKTICKTIDLSFDPNDCLTVTNGSSPYDASDPQFIETISLDGFCCEVDWDDICQAIYDGVGGGPNFNNYPLMYENTEKTLITKLFSVPHFRDRYLNISCDILENNFTLDRLVPMIDYNTDLLQDAVYEDENYIFTTDYFEYDANNELGDESVGIPPLKYFISERHASLQSDLADTGHDCNLQFAQIGWHDLVINEFMASNGEETGIADPSGSYADWIEIYNNTSETIDLGALYLSDEIDALFKWRFDLGTFLAPDSYLMVWADKDLEEEGIHADFKLAKAGDHIYLTHEDGTFIDSLAYDEQENNLASARIPNGIGDFVIQSATFASSNELPNNISEQFSKHSIQIYPNPASNLFYIDFGHNTELMSKKISVRNNLGQTVKSLGNTNSNFLEIPTNNIGSGLFTVSIIFDDGSSFVQKILIVGK